MSKDVSRREPEYWEGRLFRATFTYRGRSRRVAAWYVKIQWRGVRRTLRLRSADRREASREAAVLHAELLRSGWDGLAVRREQLGPGEVPAEGAGGGSGGLLITSRKYVNNLNPGFERELFLGVRRERGVEHLPLGTEDGGVAWTRARELSERVRREGWSRVVSTQVREATVAVFWRANPMTCTYTTMLTMPGRARAGEGPRDGREGWRVLVIEPDAGVRRGLIHWLSRGSGVSKVDGCAASDDWVPGGGWDLILANREQPIAAVRERLAGGEARAPVLVTHGVFADSDAIFASFSGVSEGYLLRRLPPADLLAPLVRAFPGGPPGQPAERERQVCRYFQALFEAPPASGSPPAPGFSAREQEVLDLLSRGFSDKEIAQELGISVWTVHSHLKRIFSKYGVRTRTEAVVKHLQK